MRLARGLLYHSLTWASNCPRNLELIDRIISKLPNNSAHEREEERKWVPSSCTTREGSELNLEPV